MKFVLEKSLGISVRSCHPGKVVLQLTQSDENGIKQTLVERTRSVALLPNGEYRDWAPAHFDALQAAHFDLISELEPELVILGTGNRQRFPDMQILQSCAAAGIGMEVMDTIAACRTFNIVQAERRKAMALLIIEEAAAT